MKNASQFPAAALDWRLVILGACIVPQVAVIAVQAELGHRLHQEALLLDRCQQQLLKHQCSPRSIV